MLPSRFECCHERPSCKAVYHFERAWRILQSVEGKAALATLLAQEELGRALQVDTIKDPC